MLLTAAISTPSYCGALVKNPDQTLKTVSQWTRAAYGSSMMFDYCCVERLEPHVNRQLAGVVTVNHPRHIVLCI
jgi:hypothetical protein